MSRPRIGVNLLWLVPGVVGGSEESSVAGLRALLDHPAGDLDLHLFVVEPFAATYPDLCDAIPTDVLRFSGRPRPLRIAAEHTWLARRTRRFDLVHHLGGTVPLVRTAPALLTIHDLQPLERTATHGPVKRAYLGGMIPPSVRAARLVVVPSEFVRSSVIAHTACPPEKVIVVPHSPGEPVEPLPADEVRRRYRIDGPVVLYPAITYPHKNHAVLIAAFARVLERHPDALLVLTGGAGPAEEEVAGAIERHGIEDRVRRPGRVPWEDLAGLYELADVLAWPSRYEGFGLPIAESMQRGLPVVAARTTAVPEVVGGAGILVGPDDVDGWTVALNEVLEDPERRRELVAAGREQARLWSPERVAAGLIDAYRRALDCAS